MHNSVGLTLPLMSPPTPRKTIRPSAMPVRKVKMVGACMSPRRVPEPVGRGKGGTGTGRYLGWGKRSRRRRMQVLLGPDGSQAGNE